MEYPRKFPPKPRRKEPEEGCKIEIKKTKNGRKVLIGKNCTKDQIQMFKETGELNLNDSQGE